MDLTETAKECEEAETNREEVDHLNTSPSQTALTSAEMTNFPVENGFGEDVGDVRSGSGSPPVAMFASARKLTFGDEDTEAVTGVRSGVSNRLLNNKVSEHGHDGRRSLRAKQQVNEMFLNSSLISEQQPAKDHRKASHSEMNGRDKSRSRLVTVYGTVAVP